MYAFSCESESSIIAVVGVVVRNSTTLSIIDVAILGSGLLVVVTGSIIIGYMKSISVVNSVSSVGFSVVSNSLSSKSEKKNKIEIIIGRYKFYDHQGQF